MASTETFLYFQLGQTYASFIHHTIFTWPTNRRISIVAIETMSLALKATLDRTEYSNVTATVNIIRVVFFDLVYLKGTQSSVVCNFNRFGKVIF